MKHVWWGLIVFGVFFSVLAAAAAYLITYGEYVRHFSEWRRARRMALEAAAVAFLVFFAVIVGATVLLGQFGGR